MVAAALVLGAGPGASAGGPAKIIPLGDPTGSGRTGSGFLSRCELPRSDSAKFACYSRALLRRIEASGDPANELPRIDRRARAAGRFLATNCHMLMHAVGRTYAKRQRITLVNLQRHLPRSNDPGCSAGFGMGMTMALGADVLRLGPKGALENCRRLPTRWQRYTCVHGLGHTYRRAYDGHLRQGELRFALRACRMLGRGYAPDCAQGAFHDYWISLSGADGTTKPARAVSARTLCSRQPGDFVTPCWFRFYLERQPEGRVETPGAIRQLCRELGGLQRAGCISAASLIVPYGPAQHARICRRLDGDDVRPCLRGVRVQDVAGRPRAQRTLIRTCGTFARDQRIGCYAWFGRTLTVATDGAFQFRGCEQLPLRGSREACVAGAQRRHDALVTFS